MNREININSSTNCSLGLLGIAFIVLKLCGVIDWPWIWVLAPIWGVFALVLGIGLICLVIIGIKAIIDKIRY